MRTMLAKDEMLLRRCFDDFRSTRMWQRESLEDPHSGTEQCGMRNIDTRIYEWTDRIVLVQVEEVYRVRQRQPNWVNAHQNSVICCHYLHLNNFCVFLISSTFTCKWCYLQQIIHSLAFLLIGGIERCIIPLCVITWKETNFHPSHPGKWKANRTNNRFFCYFVKCHILANFYELLIKGEQSYMEVIKDSGDSNE